MKTQSQKVEEYATKIVAHIGELFNEDCEYHINANEFDDEKNATAFFHVLATIAPAFIYNKLTGQNGDMLDFNHVANKLVFQFAKMDDE